MVALSLQRKYKKFTSVKFFSKIKNMNIQKIVLVFITLILLTQCTSPSTDSATTTSDSSTKEVDVHSYAQPEKGSV